MFSRIKMGQSRHGALKESGFLSKTKDKQVGRKPMSMCPPPDLAVTEGLHSLA